ESVISWFKLLYLEDAYSPWKIYWHGLTSQLDGDVLKNLSKTMQMNDLESGRMISQRLEVPDILDNLFKMKKDDNYEIYRLLSQYDTEILLFIMAKANNEKVKKAISLYFTKLKGTTIKVRGSDLEKMGYRPGPVYREIFSNLLKARLRDEVSTREDELNFIKENFKTIS
ncbi:MAG: hypothetical protein JW944_08215, partial [Deltaproteobacteria bacterium]|nr:hypothetical protein [Deltaproteobacteria bacterium]